MGYEVSKFGYAGDGVAIVTTVHNHYGQKLAEGSVGHMNTEGAMNQLTIDLDSDMIVAGELPLLNPVLPIGALVTRVTLEVSEAFVFTGLPTIEIGTDGSAATDGFSITEAQIEALGTTDLTGALSGTWTAGMLADTTVELEVGGSAAAANKVGAARVVIEYLNV